MSTRFAVLTVQLLLAVALSSSHAFASGDDEEPAKPECPKGQVWDSKQQKCLKQTNNRTDYA